jgi:hypothetical protein
MSIAAKTEAYIVLQQKEEEEWKEGKSISIID